MQEQALRIDQNMALLGAPTLTDSPDSRSPRTDTERARRKAEPVLAAKIRTLRPLALVVVMKSISECVRRAAIKANTKTTPRYVLPFPVHEHQREYVDQLHDVLLGLTKDGVLEW
jgi:hypothetical protein